MLVSASGKFNKVEFVLLKQGTQFLSFLGLETLLLEFDRVEFDAEDEAGAGALPDFLADLEDETLQYWSVMSQTKAGLQLIFTYRAVLQ